jgi:hypothetical protein
MLLTNSSSTLIIAPAISKRWESILNNLQTQLTSRSSSNKWLWVCWMKQWMLLANLRFKTDMKHLYHSFLDLQNMHCYLLSTNLRWFQIALLKYFFRWVLRKYLGWSHQRFNSSCYYYLELKFHLVNLDNYIIIKASAWLCRK